MRSRLGNLWCRVAHRLAGWWAVAVGDYTAFVDGHRYRVWDSHCNRCGRFFMKSRRLS